jgi:beta-N-acetylhexosaminidase
MSENFDPSPLIILGFEEDSAEDARRRAKDFGALGVVLFRRNCSARDQLNQLTEELGETWPGGPPIVAIDHEGPRVTRLRGIVDTPPAALDLGAENDTHQSRDAGLRMAKDLLSLGINLNFAPVLDIEEMADHPALKGRCFHEDPERVGVHGAALIEGLHAGGVTACGKHFPGHGSAPLDSHVDMPTSPRTMHELKEKDVAPYPVAFAVGLELIMPAHVTFPAIDAHPAPCSSALLTKLLREDLGFSGCVITDDCDMAGFQNLAPIRESVARCVKAGVDIFLCCRSPEVQEEVHAGLRDLYAREYGARERLDDAARRALLLRKNILDRAAK